MCIFILFTYFFPIFYLLNFCLKCCVVYYKPDSIQYNAMLYTVHTNFGETFGPVGNHKTKQ